MSVAHFVLAVLAATIVSSFTDWFFFGVLFHDRYQAHPEVWRSEFAGKQEWKSIVMATLLSAFMAVMFLFLLHAVGIHGWPQSLEFALGIWLVVALPMTVTNFIFIKLHPGVLTAHALGWLVRLLVFAASFAMLLD
jgi:hypothetical protein